MQENRVTCVALMHYGKTVDRKMIQFDLPYTASAKGLSRNQFCQEWLMPCFSIKQVMGKSASKGKKNLLKLEVYGDMVQQIVQELALARQSEQDEISRKEGSRQS